LPITRSCSLQHRPVAQLQRRAGRDQLQQRPHLLGGENLGQLLGALRAGDQLRRVLAGALGADQEAEEAADRGELARDGCRGGAGGGEPGGVAADVAVADVAGAETLRCRPCGEAAEIDAVGTPGALGGAAGAEVAVVVGQRRFPVHRAAFAFIPIRPAKGVLRPM
jgi:hypothetical protein